MLLLFRDLRISFLFLLTGALLFSSCASVPRLQSQVMALSSVGKFDEAADRLGSSGASYGSGNDLLFWLDRGLTEQAAGRYQDSIKSFEKAKGLFRELYTTSLTQEGVSWLFNDRALAYRGADYEYVLLNVFQSINFVMLGNVAEALVEARDLDARTRIFDSAAYRNQNGDHFEDNGFARLWFGLLYEALGETSALNDAWISYRQALLVYDNYYEKKYVPLLLQEEYISSAMYFRDNELAALQARFQAARPVPLAQKLQKARIYVVCLLGQAPEKVSDSILIPVGDGMVTRFSLPRLARRPSEVVAARIQVVGGEEQRTVETELGVDIADVAERAAASARAWLVAKAALRPALKQFVLRQQKKNLEKRFGGDAGFVFALLASAYNLYSEQADLRAWESLPEQIRVARIFVDPGLYRMFLEGVDARGNGVRNMELGSYDLKAGETVYILRRIWP